MTIQQAINGIKSLERLPDQAAEYMRSIVPYDSEHHNPNVPHLRDTITVIEKAPYVWTVGVTAPHAKYVRWGRRALHMPQDAKYPTGNKRRTYPFRSWDNSFIAYHAGEVKPNNFPGETAEEMRRRIRHLGLKVGNYEGPLRYS